MITAAMWLGLFSSGENLNREAADERAKDQYLQGIYGNDPTHQQWMQQTDQYRPHPEKDLSEMPGRLVMLVLWTAGAGWLLFSKRGKALQEKYLADADGGGGK